MGNSKRPRPIRLSNRTAIGLRKTAQRVRNAWLIAMGVVTMLAVVLAVYLGLMWLPAVPLTLLVTGCILTLMMITSRSRYLMLISQAICTEAASRQMEERRDELARRARAIEQLAAMRADVREAEKRGYPLDDPRTEESLLFDLLTGRDISEEEQLRIRRNEEDDELYAASYQGDESALEDAQDDLHPPKKSKASSAAEVKAPVQTTGTRPVQKVAAAAAQQAPADEHKEQATPRRRRRSAPSATAPLTLIRNDQAQ